MSVLEPLAVRYAYWLGLPAEDTSDISDDEPDKVRAMPVVLRIERAEPPGRTPLLEAAAAAAVAVCVDERAEPGGEWHEQLKAWVGGRIRKVARRARGAHWQAVQDLPGVTVQIDGAERGIGALVDAEQVVDTEPDRPLEREDQRHMNVHIFQYGVPGVQRKVGIADRQIAHRDRPKRRLPDVDGLEARLLDVYLRDIY